MKNKRKTLSAKHTNASANSRTVLDPFFTREIQNKSTLDNSPRLLLNLLRPQIIDVKCEKSQ